MENSIFKNRLALILINHLNRTKWVFLPCLLGIVLSWLNVLPLFIRDLIVPIISVVLVVIGLPLSAGLRVDQLSLNWGGSYSREFVLLVALIVAFVNLLIILGLKDLFRSKKKTEEIKPKTNTKISGSSSSEIKIKRIKN